MLYFGRQKIYYRKLCIPLYIVLNPKSIDLPDEVKADIKIFSEKIMFEDIDLKNLHITNTKDSIIQKYKKLFKIE